MKEKFKKMDTILINNGIFSKDGVFKEINAIGFCIYITLIYHENRCGITRTTISFIMKSLGLTNKYKRDIVNVLNVLKEANIINFDNNISKETNVNEILVFQITNPELSYTLLPVEDFKLLEFLNFKCFTVFCLLRRYYNEDYGYAYPKFEDMRKVTGFAYDTIGKYNDLLCDLSIIKINNKGYKMKDGKSMRSNNMYYFDDESKNIILNLPSGNMSKFLNELDKLDNEKRKKEFKLYNDELQSKKSFCSNGANVYIDKVKDVELQKERLQDSNRVEQIIEFESCENREHFEELETSTPQFKKHGGLKNCIAEMFDVHVDEKALDTVIRKLEKEHSEEVIQETLNRYYDRIRGFLIKGVFTNDGHKVNAGMKIVLNNILDVSDELAKKSQLKQKQEIEMDIMNGLELIPYICKVFELEYIPDTLLKKIDILKSEFDEKNVKEGFFNCKDSIISDFKLNDVNDSDERVKIIYKYVDQIKIQLDIGKGMNAELNRMYEYMESNTK